MTFDFDFAALERRLLADIIRRQKEQSERAWREARMHAIERWPDKCYRWYDKPVIWLMNTITNIRELNAHDFSTEPATNYWMLPLKMGYAYHSWAHGYWAWQRRWLGRK